MTTQQPVEAERTGLPAARGGVGAGLRGPVAIVGASGMLGRAFAGALARGGVAARGFARAEVDIVRAESLHALGEYPTVINCAAWTDVDGAEANESAATAVNAEGVRLLAEACRAHGSTLVHFGTDYVFAGRADRPYPLDAPRAPINAYGRSKAAGEAVLREQVERGLRVLYVRTSWLYAPWGKNFVRTIAAASRVRPTLRVVNDQRGRPTSAEHLATATLALLAARAEGLTHVTDAGECTWYDLATEIVSILGAPCRVEACTSAEFPRPARRPEYSVLDLWNAERIIGERAHWRATLRDVVGRLETERTHGA
ncbi:MAG: dTDP-4-dehydrorhamnose reductase [Planctomycetota bacterium]|nr:dTDP-4-dehydrorhamnose reductase [Planctomycetota bacterium]